MFELANYETWPRLKMENSPFWTFLKDYSGCMFKPFNFPNQFLFKVECLVSLSSFGRDVWNISYKQITMGPLVELWHITYPISFFLSCNERFIDCIKAMFIHLLLLSTYRLHKVVWYPDGLYDVLFDVRVQRCWKWPRCLCIPIVTTRPFSLPCK